MARQRQMALLTGSLVALVGLGGCGALNRVGIHLVDASVEEARIEMGASRVAQSIEGLVTPGMLTVGIRTDATAPYVFETSAQAAGLDVELGAALANELGLPVRLVYVTDIAQALGTRADIVMEVSPKEAAGFDVVGTYSNSVIALFGHGEPGPVSITELQGKTVAVQAGSTAQELLRQMAVVAQVREYEVPTITEATNAYLSGEADYFAGHIAQASYLASRLNDAAFKGALTTPEETGIAVPGDGSAVGEAVWKAFQRLSANGILDETLRRWFGDVRIVGAADCITGLDASEVETQAVSDATSDTEVATSETEQASGGQDGTDAGSNAIILTSGDYDYD